MIAAAEAAGVHVGTVDGAVAVIRHVATVIAAVIATLVAGLVVISPGVVAARSSGQADADIRKESSCPA